MHLHYVQNIHPFPISFWNALKTLLQKSKSNNKTASMLENNININNNKSCTLSKKVLLQII